MCFYNIQTITLTYIYKKTTVGASESERRKEGRKMWKKSTKSISDNGIQNIITSNMFSWLSHSPSRSLGLGLSMPSRRAARVNKPLSSWLVYDEFNFGASMGGFIIFSRRPRGRRCFPHRNSWNLLTEACMRCCSGEITEILWKAKKPQELIRRKSCENISPKININSCLTKSKIRFAINLEASQKC